MSTDLDKQLEDLKNEQILIPESVINKAEAAFSKIRNNNVKKINFRKYTAAAAVLALFIIICSGITYAKNPHVFSDICRRFYAYQDYKKYAHEINQKLEFKDTEVEINDMAFDNNILIMNYTVTYKSGYKPNDPGICILPYPETSSNVCTADSDAVKPARINDNTISYMKLYIFNYISDNKMPDNCNFKLQVINYETSETKNIYLNINKKNLNDKLHTIKISKDYKTSEGTFTINKAMLSPFGTIVNIRTKGIDITDNNLYKFSIYDDNGNEINRVENIGFKQSDSPFGFINLVLRPDQYKSSDKLTIKCINGKTNKTVYAFEIKEGGYSTSK